MSRGKWVIVLVALALCVVALGVFLRTPRGMQPSSAAEDRGRLARAPTLGRQMGPAESSVAGPKQLSAEDYGRLAREYEQREAERRQREIESMPPSNIWVPLPEAPVQAIESSAEGTGAPANEAAAQEREGDQRAGGRDGDGLREALEAEIRVEYRSLATARQAYLQATPGPVGQTRMPFRRAFGLGDDGGDAYGDIQFYVADAAWAGASQQHEVVRNLLDAYREVYGASALDSLMARERMDMTPLRGRHLTREQRREFVHAAFAAAREELARAMSQSQAKTGPPSD